MNAYELADQLDNVKYQNGAKPFEMYANMLRQQADLIRNLQKSLGFKNSGYETINLTSQTKPLSDEEVIKIRQATKAKSTENWADTLAFSRAIEERHGIK